MGRLLHCRSNFTGGVIVRGILIDDFYEPSGAFNSQSSGRRDPMNKRLLNALRSNVIDSKPVEGVDYYKDAFLLDFSTPPPAPKDSDNDGMPDAWEIKYGLDAGKSDHNGTQLSTLLTGISGYTNLECYLNELSKQINTGSTTSIKEIGKQKPEIAYLGDGRFKVVFSSYEGGGKYIATLTDLTGRLMLQFPVENGIGEATGKNLPKGIYLLSLSNGVYHFSSKLFVD